MSTMSALARMPVGVLVARIKAASPWTDFTWQPVAVLPGAPQAEPWTQLDGDGEKATFYAGAAAIELFRSEVSNYRENLADHGALWVALRPTGSEPPYELAAVTADPAEGESFTEAGENLVEIVSMPASVRDFVAAFVAEYAAYEDDYKFVKRKRDRANPEALARRGRIHEDDSE